MRYFVIIVVGSVLMNVSSTLTAEDASSLAEAFQTAVVRIESYDVSVMTTFMVYPHASDLKNKKNPSVDGPAQLMRDVFAHGLGRRVETFPNDVALHTVAVKDWKSASAGDRPLSMSLTYGVGGLNYFDYFNPNCGGYFLADLMRDGASSLRELPPLGTDKFPGFEVLHPKYKGFVRVWLNPKFDYMPVTIEKHEQNEDGTTGLAERVVNTEFTKVGVASVPTVSTYTVYSSAGPSKGRALTGNSYAVDVEKSNWNSIHSGDLFSYQKLARVNNEYAGWKRQVPDDTKVALDKAEQFRLEVLARSQPSHPYRTVLIVVNVIIVLLVAAFLLSRRMIRRRLSTS